MGIGTTSINSLRGVNAWLGHISSNLQAAHRTGYKTTRPNLSDGLGVNRVLGNLQIPETSLNINSTTIEWQQGAIRSSQSKAHFALNGQGYFIVQDEFGRYYATRDGEFHWDSQGYLVNSAGLKVVSQGQDFIRLDTRTNTNDDDIINQDGYSQELFRFGNKTIMVADFGNRQGIKMSKYGSTTFEVPGLLPFNIQNDFQETADGITFDYNSPIASVGTPVYTEDPANGRVIIDATASVAGTYARVKIGESLKASTFATNIEFDNFAVSGGPASYLGFNFAQPTEADIPDAAATTPRGYQLRISDAGVAEVFRHGVSVAGPVAGPALTGAGPHDLAIQLNDQGEFSASIDGTLLFNKLQLINVPEELRGHVSMTVNDASMDLNSLHFDPKQFLNVSAIGSMFQGNLRPFEPGSITPPIPRTPGGTNFTTRVMQQNLEASTALLMEYIPLLSLAQKVFSSISKIINVHNSQQDDLNQLIR